jgi:hypothetical protein
VGLCQFSASARPVTASSYVVIITSLHKLLEELQRLLWLHRLHP